MSDLEVRELDDNRAFVPDPIAESLIGFLTSTGASDLRHGAGRTLLEHLIETFNLIRRWEQPTWLQYAALIHSVYGTDAYHPRLLDASRRSEVRAIAGDRAERLAFLFSVIPREFLFAGTHLWARNLPWRDFADAAGQEPATREELDCVVLLHMANLAEQAREVDGSPARWLVRLRDLAEMLISSDAVSLPLFLAPLAALGDEEESLAREAYRAALRAQGDPEARCSLLGLTAALCPVVPEPCVWQAHAARSRGDVTGAQSWARCARERLITLGTSWDKRLSFEQWHELTRALERPPEAGALAYAGAMADPGTLFEAMVDQPAQADPRELSYATAARSGHRQDELGGAERFHRYVESFSHGGGPPLGGTYPGLTSQPWHEPQGFSLVSYLESHFSEIQAEILALDPARFHRESERIKRSGDWDVAFLYERGRRRAEVCRALPVSTRGVEAYPTMRTMSGLIYASRMRGGTHIAAHRGPTNLRVRCHLAITVPVGDCAIRVGDDTRVWREGSCLVFDDSFEHEAWNHTERDRIVLIVDLWHPDLSAIEVRLLEGLHSYTGAHARNLGRYWAANAAATRQAAGE